MISNKYREVIVYIIAGVLTTIVYYITRFTSHIFWDNSVLCAAIAQVISITFAFWINKFWVFKKMNCNWRTLLSEISKFYSGRVIMLIFDLLMSFIFIEQFSSLFIQKLHLEELNYEFVLFRVLHTFIGSPKLLYEFVITTCVQVITIVVNYVVSKFLVFTKDATKDTQ